MVVQLDAVAADLPAKAVWWVIDTARSFAHRGLQVAVGGATGRERRPGSPGSAEMIGLMAAIVAMLLAFGPVITVRLPILAALAGLGIGFGVLEALSHPVAVPTFEPGDPRGRTRRSRGVTISRSANGPIKVPDSPDETARA